MKQSFKWNALPLNAHDDSFCNTKVDFRPEHFDYDENKIPYDAMESLCDYLVRLEKDYVTRSNIKHENIKNEDKRLKAIRKQVIDCQKTENKAQAILRWLGIKRKSDVEEPKGTKWIERSPKSGWKDGMPKEVPEVCPN